MNDKARLDLLDLPTSAVLSRNVRYEAWHLEIIIFPAILTGLTTVLLESSWEMWERILYAPRPRHLEWQMGSLVLLGFPGLIRRTDVACGRGKCCGRCVCGGQIGFEDPIPPNELLGSYESTFCWFGDKAYGHFQQEQYSMKVKLLIWLWWNRGPWRYNMYPTLSLEWSWLASARCTVSVVSAPSVGASVSSVSVMRLPWSHKQTLASWGAGAPFP